MDVLMPQLGETVAEGKIVKWFVKAGDTIKPGDNLFEIETDKTSMEVPATFGGTLTDIHFSVGEDGKVGAAVATIGVEGEHCGAKEAPAAKPVLIPPHAPPVASGADRQSRSGSYGSAYTPIKMDLFNEVRLSGAQLRTRQNGERQLCHPAGAPAGVRTRHRPVAFVRLRSAWPHRRRRRREGASLDGRRRDGDRRQLSRRSRRWYDGIEFQEVPLDGMRATIAKRLVEAKQTIPHFYLTADIDIGRLVAMREDANKSAPQQQGRRGGI